MVPTRKIWQHSSQGYPPVSYFNFDATINIKSTRHSENDNTPQPLDQWRNRPFIGQQVGNCKSFTLTQYLADLFAMHRGQGQSHCASNIISNSHPFHSKGVDPPIPKLQQFQYLTLKIQGQGHGWGQIWSHNVSLTFYRLTSLSFHVNRPYNFFKIWPWKSKVKVMK